MPKRRIEAEVAVDVTGIEKVEKLEETVDGLGDNEIEVGVDVDLTRLEKFERELDELDLDATRELRVEFRSQLLQQEIRSALRDIERLEDPILISTRTAELQAAQQELRELSELAGRKYQIDVDIDPRRNARQAAGDLDLVRQRGEGLQSALPALRGFTDELGGTAATAGIAGQAMADLGDFSLILGERFGISEKKTAAIGTALGAAGLAGIVGAVLLPVLKDFIDSQDDLEESTIRATGAISDQSGAVEALEAAIASATDGDPLVQAILGQFDEDEAEEAIDRIGDALVRIGRTIDGDLAQSLRQAGNREGLVEILSELPELAGQGEEAIESLALLIDRTRNFDDAGGLFSFGDQSRSFEQFRELLRSSDDDVQDFVDSNRELFEAIIDVSDAAGGVNLGDAYRGVLTDIRQTEEGVRRLDQAFANVGESASLETVIAEYQRLTAESAELAKETDKVDEAVTRVGGSAERTALQWSGMTESILANLRDIRDETIQAVSEVDAFGSKVDEVSAGLDDESSLLNIADQFDRVRDAAVKAAEATAGPEREKALRNYRREQIRLTEQTLAYLETVEDIPVDVVTRIRGLIDRQDYIAAERLLDELTQDRFSKLTVDIVPQLNEAFKTISVRIEPNQAPVQTSTQFELPQQNITINYPPGTPANTAENQLINQARNGTRTAI